MENLEDTSGDSELTFQKSKTYTACKEGTSSGQPVPFQRLCPGSEGIEPNVGKPGPRPSDCQSNAIASDSKEFREADKVLLRNREPLNVRTRSFFLADVKKSAWEAFFTELFRALAASMLHNCPGNCHFLTAEDMPQCPDPDHALS